MNLLLAREDIDQHPVLRVLSEQCSTAKSINIKKKPSFIVKALFWKGEFVVTDPLVALLCIWRAFTFYSLEMFEYQVEEKSLKSKLRNRIFKYTHYLALKRAKTIVFPNQIRKDFYLKKYKLQSNKVKIQPNYPSQKTLGIISEIRENVHNIGLSLNDFLSTHGVNTSTDFSDKEIFVYIGSINRGNRGIENILTGVKKRKNAILVIAGPQREPIFSVGEETNCHIYIGKLHHKEALKLLFLAKYGVLYYSSSLKNTDYCAPVKIFEYINAGIGIVSNRCKGLEEYNSVISMYLEDDGTISENDFYKEDAIHRLMNVDFESNFKC